MSDENGPCCQLMRRDGRVVDGGSLENYYARKRIGGSPVAHYYK